MPFCEVFINFVRNAIGPGDGVLKDKSIFFGGDGDAEVKSIYTTFGFGRATLGLSFYLAGMGVGMTDL